MVKIKNDPSVYQKRADFENGGVTLDNRKPRALSEVEKIRLLATLDKRVPQKTAYISFKSILKR